MGILDVPGVASVPWVIQPAGWNTTWKAAKAASGTTPAVLAYIGDSITAGQGSTNVMTKSWLSLTRATLVSRYGLSGDFLPLWPYTTSGGTSNPSTTLPWSAIESGATAGGTFSFGLGKQGPMVTTTGVPLWLFTSPYACTAMDIVYCDNQLASGGSWQYRVDGGTWQTVTLTAGSNAATVVKKISLTGLSNAVHTIELGNQSAANTLFLQGISCFAATTGVRFTWSGYNGIQLADMALTTQGPPDKLALWGGKPSSAGSFRALGFPTQPHAAVIELGVNDLGGGQTTANYQLWLNKLIRALRRGQDQCSIALLCPADVDGTYSDLTNAAGANWYTFKLAMRQIADVYGCAFIDIDSKWGSLTVSKGFQSTDVHPTDAGHADMAATISAVL